MANLNNVVCGPRCVRFVLEHFGTETDLVELVREMQWPQLSEGASAASLVEALEKRGVHVKPVQVDPKSSVFRWEHPIILHLKPEGEHSLGHFVVWMPESTNHHVVLYDGLAGFQVETKKSFSSKMSGIVLLTSTKPISGDVHAVYGFSPNAVKSQLLIAVCVYTLLAILRKRNGFTQTLYEILQILNASIFEKTSLFSVFSDKSNTSEG